MGSEQAEGAVVFVGFVREAARATRPKIFVVGWRMAPDWCISPRQRRLSKCGSSFFNSESKASESSHHRATCSVSGFLFSFPTMTLL